MFYADGVAVAHDDSEINDCMNNPNADSTMKRAHKQAKSLFYVRCKYCNGQSLPVFWGPDGIPHLAPERYWRGKTRTEFEMSTDNELLF